ncbi:MAG: SRPBCC family protein [Hylemonella sp.]|nr:SRPBCC family protein [Hylemonella sp.]
MKTYSVQASILISASPQAIQAVYADVAHWHLWDPDTRSAQLDGPFAVGTTGSLRPPKGLAVRMLVTEVTLGGGFTLQSPVLGSKMTFEHVLAPVAQGVEVMHRVTFSGWGRALLMRLVGKPLGTGLPVTLANLKRYVEERS